MSDSQVKFWAIIANTQIDLEGERFSKECLKYVSEQSRDIRLVHSFGDIEPIGDVSDLNFDGENLACKVNANIEIDTSLYPVCGFIVNKKHLDGDVLVYDNIEIRDVSLTDKPVTIGTKIKRLT